MAKKSFTYIVPGDDGADKIEVMDLSAFRNQQRMQKLATSLGVPLGIGEILLANKRFDGTDLDFFAELYASDLKSISHPIENWNISKESFKELRRVIEADGGKIGVYGDYDGDGVTSAIIIHEMLRTLVPEERIVMDFSRVGEDGFGFSLRGAQHFLDEDCRFVFVLDTGSASSDTLQLMAESKISVAVIDHHLVGEEVTLVPGIMYVNPHLNLETTPNPEELRNAGLSWFYARAFLNDAGQGLGAHYGYCLAIAALGTIADAGSQFEGIYNRALLHEGFLPEILAQVEAYHLVFRVEDNEMMNDMSAPEIARGFRIMSLAKRMKNIIPDMVFALFAKESPMELRMEMLGILEDKYELFLDIADRASDAMLAKIDPRDKIIVEIAPAEIVPSGYIGMSGTLASRIMSRLKKPAIIFVEDCDGTLKGSWRTGEINGETLMRTIAAKSPGILEKFGGHAPAGGLLLETRKRFSTFKFLVQDELESLRVVPPKEWYDNPNVRKYFSTISRDSKAFVVEEFDRIWLLAPFNRYDVKRPSVFVTNVLVENIETTGNEKLLRFIDGAGHSVEVSLGEDTTTEIKDHSVVDLLLVLSILTPDSFGYSSELVIPSQFRMQG